MNVNLMPIVNGKKTEFFFLTFRWLSIILEAACSSSKKWQYGNDTQKKSLVTGVVKVNRRDMRVKGFHRVKLEACTKVIKQAA